ncbi:MAG: VCBS repeat-containing protein [Polyangiaceae bacterium]
MRVLSLLSCVVFACGCTELPDIPAGTCGNGFVDPGEDCDGPGASCGAPESTGACRFLCSTDLSCPGGYACGSDGVCRQPTGQYTHVNELSSDSDMFSALADMDGDGIRDLVNFDPSTGIRVSFLDGQAAVVSEARVPSAFGTPALGQLTDSEATAQELPRTDLVESSSGAINVLRGRGDRSLEPTSYSSIPVADFATFVAFDARPPDKQEFRGDEVLRFLGNDILSVNDGVNLFKLPFNAENLAGEVLTAAFDTKTAPLGEPLSPWDEFAVAEWDGTQVYVFSPTRWVLLPGGKAAWNKDPGLYPPVKLPNGKHVVAGPFAIDANDDEHLDLVVIGGAAAGEPSLALNAFVAYGRGDASFHSDGDALPPDGSPADQTFAQLSVKFTSPPLAIGHLNQDSKPDFVFPNAVIISGEGPDECLLGNTDYSCFRTDDEWNSARIVQLNGTGGPDIIAAAANTRSVEFWNSTGDGLFHRFQIPTKNFPSRLTVSDLDGDLLPDVALVESQSPTFASYGPVGGASFGIESDVHDTVSVMFGRAFGAPEAPISVGELGHVEAIVAGRIGGDDDTPDLGALSAYSDDKGNVTRSIAIFEGATNRLLTAPFRLIDPDTESEHAAARTWVGDFDGDGHADVSALGVDIDELTTHQAFALRGWFLPSTGEAEVSEASTKSSANLTAGFDWCTALALPIDLGQDGQDELVFLGRRIKDNQHQEGALAVWNVNDKGAWVESGAPVGAKLRFSAPPAERLPCEAARSLLSKVLEPDQVSSGQIFAAEVDDVPGLDVVALGFDAEGSYSVMILLQRDGGLSPDSALVLPSPSELPLLGVMPIQADRDPQTELLLFSPAGIDLAEIDLDAQRLVVRDRVRESELPFGVEPIPAGPTPSGNGPVPGLAGGGIGSLFAPYQSAAAGDINGDGLQDFVVVQEGSIHLFLAKDAFAD